MWGQCLRKLTSLRMCVAYSAAYNGYFYNFMFYVISCTAWMGCWKQLKQSSMEYMHLLITLTCQNYTQPICIKMSIESPPRR